MDDCSSLQQIIANCYAILNPNVILNIMNNNFNTPVNGLDKYYKTIKHNQFMNEIESNFSPINSTTKSLQLMLDNEKQYELDNIKALEESIKTPFKKEVNFKCTLIILFIS